MKKSSKKNSLFTIPQPPSFTKNDHQSETFIILRKNAVYLQSPRLCSSRKHPYMPTKDKEYSEGRGVQKAAISEGEGDGIEV